MDNRNRPGHKKVTAAQRARTRKRIERQQKRKASLRPHYILDLDKSRYAEHAEVAPVIEKLLSKKKFLPTAVRGILIKADLDAGNIDTLLMYHPDIEDHFRTLFREQDDDDLKKKIDEQQKMIDNLNQTIEALRVLIENLRFPALPASPPAAAPLKPYAARPLPDDADTVVLKRDTSADGNATQNFLNAAFGINGIKVDTPAPKAAGGIKALTGFKDIPMPTIDD